MDEGLQEGLAGPKTLGRVVRIDEAPARYVEIVKATFPQPPDAERACGSSIDCANGAAYKVAPTALYELGAEVIPVGVTPERLQHQRGVRLDPSGHDRRGGAAIPRRHRHRAGRRRRPAGDLRREGPDRRRRPDHGADRRVLGRAGAR